MDLLVLLSDSIIHPSPTKSRILPIAVSGHLQLHRLQICQIRQPSLGAISLAHEAGQSLPDTLYSMAGMHCRLMSRLAFVKVDRCCCCCCTANAFGSGGAGCWSLACNWLGTIPGGQCSSEIPVERTKPELRVPNASCSWPIRNDAAWLPRPWCCCRSCLCAIQAAPMKHEAQCKSCMLAGIVKQAELWLSCNRWSKYTTVHVGLPDTTCLQCS